MSRSAEAPSTALTARSAIDALNLASKMMPWSRKAKERRNEKRLLVIDKKGN
jgi:hypothetical protein